MVGFTCATIGVGLAGSALGTVGGGEIPPQLVEKTDTDVSRAKIPPKSPFEPTIKYQSVYELATFSPKDAIRHVFPGQTRVEAYCSTSVRVWLFGNLDRAGRTGWTSAGAESWISAEAFRRGTAFLSMMLIPGAG